VMVSRMPAQKAARAVGEGMVLKSHEKGQAARGGPTKAERNADATRASAKGL